MITSKQDLIQWFDRGVAVGATHMIVMHDSYDHEDYPVFVPVTEDVRDVAKRCGEEAMQRVMEVYRLDLGKDAQWLGDARCPAGTSNRVFNY